MIVNLTPHYVNIYNADGSALLLSVPPSGTVTRVAMTRERAIGLTPDGSWVESAHPWAIPVYATRFEEVVGLPTESQEYGTVYIVSLAVRMALPNRFDLVSPGELVRNAEGQPIGCKGLDSN